MIALIILSIMIFLAALGAVWMARPVHAALMLAMTLAVNAVVYLVIGAYFIGLVQFMVYVGAVAVLIVFSLLITRRGDEAAELAKRPGALATGLICIAPVFGTLAFMLSKLSRVESTPEPPTLPVEKIGMALFTTYTPAVLAMAVLLTAVMIGAALFARESGRKSQTPPNP